MKRILIFAAAIAAFVGCSKDQTEEFMPENLPADNEPTLVYTEINAENGGMQPHAAFDGALNAYWEENDQILAVQSLASADSWTATGKTYTGEARVFTLSNGAGGKSATFSGEINDYLEGENSYIHFAHPASQATLTTKTAVPAFAWNERSTSTTATFTVAGEQDGVWQPSLIASTTSAIAATALGSQSVFFTNLNSSLAIRVVDSEGNPKQIKEAHITAANNLVGTLSGTSSVSTTDELGKPFTADLFSANATGNTITANSLQNVAPHTDGNYLYCFEVLPVDAGEITITLVDMQGLYYTRKVTLGKSFEANRRHGVNFKWGEVSLTADVDTWYEEVATNPGTTLEGGKLYISNINIPGADDATTVYMTLNNGTAEAIGTYGALRGMTYTKSLSVGTYAITLSATVGTKTVSADFAKSVTDILSLSANIKSSYHSNGVVTKDNGLNGSAIYVTPTITGAYGSLVPTITVKHNSGSLGNATLGTENTYTPGWATYTNCHVEAVFPNGLTLTSAKYTTSVTGIPYSIVPSVATPDGWTTSNTRTWKDYTQLKHGTAYALLPKFHHPETINVVASFSLHAYRTAGTYKPNIYISAQTSGAAGGSATQLTGNSSLSDETLTDVPRTFDLSGDYRVCIYSTGDKPGAAISSSCGIAIKNCSVKYN